MTDVNTLSNQINERCSAWIVSANVKLSELTVEVKPEHLLDLCQVLRDDPEFNFRMLLDVCGIDYLHYGLDEWQTESTSATGFSRGVMDRFLPPDLPLEKLPPATPLAKKTELEMASPANPPSEAELQKHHLEETKVHDQAGGIPAAPGKSRFAVIYHLLSLSKNHRIRLRVSLADEKELLVDSVMSLWPSANWFEREAFDLYGILFRDHPDLRRLLTDYGFVGHPFRKDFPLIGKVEARYDAKLKRVVYEPVSIEPRILEPKVIRQDHRYLVENPQGATNGK